MSTSKFSQIIPPHRLKPLRLEFNKSQKVFLFCHYCVITFFILNLFQKCRSYARYCIYRIHNDLFNNLLYITVILRASIILNVRGVQNFIR